METIKDITAIASVTCITSLQIAEATGKRHKHVVRDIRNLLDQGCGQTNFGPSSYINSQNKVQPCYNLTKNGALILASGYNALLREKIIDRLEELEAERMQRGTQQIATREQLLKDEGFIAAIAERLKLTGGMEDSEGKIKRLERELKREVGRVEYFQKLNEFLIEENKKTKRELLARKEAKGEAVTAEEKAVAKKRMVATYHGGVELQGECLVYTSLAVARKLGLRGARWFNLKMQDLGIQRSTGRKGEWRIQPPFDTLGIHTPLYSSDGIGTDNRRLGWTRQGLNFFIALLDNDYNIVEAVQSIGEDPTPFYGIAPEKDPNEPEQTVIMFDEQ